MWPLAVRRRPSSSPPVNHIFETPKIMVSCMRGPFVLLVGCSLRSSYPLGASICVVGTLLGGLKGRANLTPLFRGEKNNKNEVFTLQDPNKIKN